MTYLSNGALIKAAQEKLEQLNRQQEQHVIFDGDMIESKSTPQNMLYIPPPTAKEFHNDDSFVRLIMGPYGSGKTTTCIHEIVKRTCEMPAWKNGRRNARWAIVRNTSGELHSTTLRTWLSWFAELGAETHRSKPLLQYEHIFRDEYGVIELELIFLALDRPDDVKKIKSLEVTGVYLNEASELYSGVLSHFKGRLNGRYPSRAFCPEPYWSGIIADTNPPDQDHWIYEQFVKSPTEGYKIFRQPPGLLKTKSGDWEPNPAAENIEHLSPDYYVKLASGQKEDFVKVFCNGEWGIVETGKRVFPEFNSDLHSKDALNPIEGLPLHLGFDFGLCYSDDTEVLTNSGWKLFKDVNEEVDEVATRDPVSKNFEYTKINFKTEFDYDGELLEWASQNVNFCVTPEHRVPYTKRNRPDEVLFQSAEWLAKNMSTHHYVDLCSNWSGDESLANKSFFGMDALTYVQFMGLYLSEGSTDKNGNSYRIQIAQNAQDEEMQEILDRTEVDWVFSSNGWRATDNEIGPFLYSQGKAQEKRVPVDIKMMPRELIKEFIYAYTRGDGHIRTRENGSIEHTLYTSSRLMADDMQELAQKAGWYSSCRFISPTCSTIIEDGIDRVITSAGGYSITFKKKAKRAELLKRNFRRINYKGKIYCLNVPYHTLYVRRNGRPSWNGNTPSCIVVQFTPRGQIRALKEFCAQDMGIRSFVENIVLPGIAMSFPGFKIDISRADPAGAAKDTIYEELSCISEITDMGIPTEPAMTNQLEPRLNAVSYFLNRMIDGEPAFLVSRETCPILYRGFARDYVYKRLAVIGEERFKEVPDKNHASHIHDGLQYIMLEFASNYIASTKAKDLDDFKFYNPRPNGML